LLKILNKNKGICFKLKFNFKKFFLRLAHKALSALSFLFVVNVFFLNHDDPNDLGFILSIFRKKFVVLGPIGVDLDYYAHTPVQCEDVIKFLFVGRLLKEKGVVEFVDAARMLHKEFPNSLFTIVGGFDVENPSCIAPDIFTSLQADNFINHVDHVFDVRAYYEECHVFVLPSYREGFPRSTQEAMAIGRAVLTTDVPGCRESIISGLGGYLCEARDPTSLYLGMRYFMEHPDLITSMGSFNRKHASALFNVRDFNSRLLTMLDV